MSHPLTVCHTPGAPARPGTRSIVENKRGEADGDPRSAPASPHQVGPGERRRSGSPLPRFTGDILRRRILIRRKAATGPPCDLSTAPAASGSARQTGNRRIPKGRQACTSCDFPEGVSNRAGAGRRITGRSVPFPLGHVRAGRGCRVAADPGASSTGREATRRVQGGGQDPLACRSGRLSLTHRSWYSRSRFSLRRCEARWAQGSSSDSGRSLRA